MEQSTKAVGYKLIVASVMLSFMNAAVFAQDSTVTKSHSTLTTTETTWYAEPWVWALGAAILIIIIVALVRGGGSSRSGGTVDKVTYSKKVERDDNA
ncbi:MAG TPA: hypothetical protein DIT07_05625 [Sphingobacteriaceae bacterium]|nr:hypothetical protein [Sphingobacteriaceae bacterium]